MRGPEPEPYNFFFLPRLSSYFCNHPGHDRLFVDVLAIPREMGTAGHDDVEVKMCFNKDFYMYIEVLGFNLDSVLTNLRLFVPETAIMKKLF